MKLEYILVGVAVLVVLYLVMNRKETMNNVQIFNKTSRLPGCSSDEDLINNICYQKCPSGFISDKTQCIDEKLYDKIKNDKKTFDMSLEIAEKQRLEMIEKVKKEQLKKEQEKKEQEKKEQEIINARAMKTRENNARIPSFSNIFKLK
jgi:hypothetical protein